MSHEHHGILVANQLLVQHVAWTNNAENITALVRGNFHWQSASNAEWVSESINLTSFLGTADSEVHIVHISCVIIAYILESLSSLKYITHNLQATIYFKEKGIKKENTKNWGHPLSWFVIEDGNSTSFWLVMQKVFTCYCFEQCQLFQYWLHLRKYSLSYITSVNMQNRSLAHRYLFMLFHISTVEILENGFA